MKAAIYEQYGAPDVVHIGEVKTPIPKDDEILIKIHATTVSAGDWRIRSLNVPAGFGILIRLAFGLCKPRHSVLGTELAGKVVEVGKNVSTFKPGDRVFAFPGGNLGAHAEYIAMRMDAPIALIPNSFSDEQAAALSFGGTTALNFLKLKGNIKPGERVLINGASGAVGTAAVQLAKHFGAHVTGVCSTANINLVKSLGADEVIDYTKEDFTGLGLSWDIVMDTVGNAPWSRVKSSLADNGRLLMVVADLRETLSATFVTNKNGKKAISGTARECAEDLRYLAELAEQGGFEPVVDRSYPLDKIAEAHAYVDTGRKRGNVVVTVI